MQNTIPHCLARMLYLNKKAMLLFMLSESEEDLDESIIQRPKKKKTLALLLSPCSQDVQSPIGQFELVKSLTYHIHGKLVHKLSSFDF